MSRFDYAYGMDSMYSKMSIETQGDFTLLHTGWNDDLGEVITLRGVQMA